MPNMCISLDKGKKKEHSKLVELCVVQVQTADAVPEMEILQAC